MPEHNILARRQPCIGPGNLIWSAPGISSGDRAYLARLVASQTVSAGQWPDWDTAPEIAIAVPRVMAV
jgi:hypothetical protein